MEEPNRMRDSSSAGGTSPPAHTEQTMSKQPSPNDNRSNVKNPNNPAQAADQANRQAQAAANETKSPAPTVPVSPPTKTKS